MSNLYNEIYKKYSEELQDLKEALKNLVVIKPERIISFFAYKNGEVKEFETEYEAKRFSDNVERSSREIISTEYQAYKIEDTRLYNAINDLENKIYDEWEIAIQKIYKISDEEFKIISCEAWEDGRDYGLNVVAEKFQNYANMYMKLKEL